MLSNVMKQLSKKSFIKWVNIADTLMFIYQLELTKHK